MEGVGGYVSSWRVVPINVSTWQGNETVPKVKAMKVVNKATDDVPKLQSGSMTIDLPAGERFKSGWYRLQMIGRDGTGQGKLIDIATLLFEQTSGKNDYGVETVTVKGQSVLKPVEDRHMKHGSYIDKFDNGAWWCHNVLNECTPAPVVLDDEKGFEVDRYYVFDGGTSCLKAVWKVLDSAGWILQIQGDGTIHILEKPKDFKVEYGRSNLKYIKPGISYDEDLSNVPNVYYARLNGLSAEARNEDPDSEVSIQNRTYIKDITEMDPIPINGETLDHYVNRRLEEESTIYKMYDYSHMGLFEVNVFDNVYWNIPTVHTGVMRVLEQTITCDKGMQFEERSGEEIKLWQMIH